MAVTGGVAAAGGVGSAVPGCTGVAALEAAREDRADTFLETDREAEALEALSSSRCCLMSSCNLRVWRVS